MILDTKTKRKPDQSTVNEGSLILMILAIILFRLLLFLEPKTNAKRRRIENSYAEVHVAYDSLEKYGYHFKSKSAARKYQTIVDRATKVHLFDFLVKNIQKFYFSYDKLGANVSTLRL